MLYDILPTSPNLVRFYCYKPFLNGQIKLLAYSCPKLSQLWLDLVKDYDQFDFDDDGLCAVANGCRHLTIVELMV